MNLSLYASATGMEAQQLNLNNIANNIANVNSTGYKRSKVEFQDLLYQSQAPKGGDVGGGGTAPTGIEVGNGSRAVSTTKVFSQGQLTQTDNQWDVAIDGEGFFQLTRADGSTVYTRDGSLKVDPTGQIVNNNGLVYTGLGAVPANVTGVFVAPTGEVSFETPNGIVPGPVIQMTRFSNPNGLKSLGGNLYEETQGSGAPVVGNAGTDGFGVLRQNYLEMSNVNVVEEMVNMIVAQRAYEINSKAIQTSDEMMATVNQLKR
ncbi:MAG: flagellar basal-body rod protein FlgG [Verrucomicrobiota bacterium JB022]|nr:flagellar basal-body rod protein FlgG [Verrucomicrobiota bacterium JB022]